MFSKSQRGVGSERNHNRFEGNGSVLCVEQTMYT